jgi:hypothetical protein
MEGGKPEDPEKNRVTRERTNKQLNSRKVPEPRIEPTTHWTTAVRGERITATPPITPITSPTCVETSVYFD